MNRSQFRRDLTDLLREHGLFIATVTFKENPVKLSLDVMISASSILDPQVAMDFDSERTEED